MKTHKTSRPSEGQKIKPGRDHWWWRASRLKRALDENPQLDHFFYWKVKGRTSPRGVRWSREQRLSIETSLWLYELDARISHRYLFGRPTDLLSAKNIDAVVAFANPTSSSRASAEVAQRRRAFAWEWIEYFDKRDATKAPKLTRTELNGIIAAMKYCVEYFLHG